MILMYLTALLWPLRSLQIQAVSSPCNFATALVRGCILLFRFHATSGHMHLMTIQLWPNFDPQKVQCFRTVPRNYPFKFLLLPGPKDPSTNAKFLTSCGAAFVIYSALPLPPVFLPRLELLDVSRKSCEFPRRPEIAAISDARSNKAILQFKAVNFMMASDCDLFCEFRKNHVLSAEVPWNLTAAKENRCCDFGPLSWSCKESEASSGEWVKVKKQPHRQHPRNMFQHVAQFLLYQFLHFCDVSRDDVPTREACMGSTLSESIRNPLSHVLSPPHMPTYAMCLLTRQERLETDCASLHSLFRCGAASLAAASLAPLTMDNVIVEGSLIPCWLIAYLLSPAEFSCACRKTSGFEHKAVP